MDNTKEQDLAMQIIANAGDSKSSSIEAMDCALDGEMEEAHECLKHAQETLLAGHKAHTDLIVLDAQEGVKVNMLLVHASNHLSSAESALLTAEKIIAVLEKIEKR